MLVNSKETSHAVATDVVDWALQQKIIDVNQRRQEPLEWKVDSMIVQYRSCTTAISIILIMSSKCIVCIIHT